jgi:hypothetical protein
MKAKKDWSLCELRGPHNNLAALCLADKKGTRSICMFEVDRIDCIDNARLMLSAPEMLDALKRIIDDCDNNGLTGFYPFAREAIKKAEGSK